MFNYSKKISYYSLGISHLFVFVALIMYLVMDTANDREAYINHFENPFGNSRIEIGFHYYMQAFHILKIPATVSIITTCVLIFFFLSRVWFRYIKFHWLVSILVFNFFVFGLMNYYLGTSIRMGLAIGITLYASTNILERKKFFWLLLFASFFIHYGAILYILVFTWVYLFQKKGLMFHVTMILLGSFSLFFLFDVVLPYLGLSSYYMAYIESDLGRTDRVFPFTILFSLLALFFIFIRFGKLVSKSLFLSLLVIYVIPFLIFQIATGNPLFAKMIMPIIFLQSIALSYLYIPMFVKTFKGNLTILVLLFFNFLSLIYALSMYQFL
jgi:hypothetical protein